MQCLADLLKIKIHNIGIEEVSALGAAYMAGLKINAFANIDQLTKLSVVKSMYHPSKESSEIEHDYYQWLEHIKQLTIVPQ